LFISHFDEDHLNGIKNLINKFCIKKVFIPYLNSFEKLSIFLEKNISFNSSMSIQNNRKFLDYVIYNRDYIFSYNDNIEIITAESEVNKIQIGVEGSNLVDSANLEGSIESNKNPFWEFAYFSLIPGSEFEQNLFCKFKCHLGDKLCNDIKNNNVRSIYDNWSSISGAS